MTFDDSQLAAIEAEGNVVVSAGAGSGKTRVLTERFLRLVEEKHVDVRRILTLTFTRKAAAEMRERIHRRLLARSGSSFVGEQLELFNEAQISTLDSFCARIVREGGREYGVPPDFRLDEQENEALAEEVALEFLLDHENDEVLHRFISANGFGKVWKEFLASLVTGLFNAAGPVGLGEMVERQLAAVRKELEQLLAALRREAGHFCAFDPGNGKAIRKRQEDVARLSLADVRIPGSDAQPGGADWSRLEETLGACAGITKQLGQTKLPHIEEVKESIGRLRELAGRAQNAMSTLRMEAQLRRAFSLLSDLEERARRAKQRRGCYTYRDVLLLALRILREQEEVRRHYSDRFRYIMIDEFQDNNALQKELLYLLAGRHDGSSGEQKLFFVGDDKQSIYRFRGADVSVFKSLADELEREGGRHVRLRGNYRSTRHLRRFFDFLFPSVMGDATEPFEAAYHSIGDEPVGREAGGGAEDESSVLGVGSEHAPMVRICVKHHRDEEDERDGVGDSSPAGAGDEENLSGDEAEAFYVARTIRELVERQALPLQADGRTRPAGYSDIALLMRSTSNQIIFERMLRLFDVPYTTQSVRSLFMDAPAYDIYHVLQLAVYPEDRLAYAGLLRSPLVNISDRSIAQILRQDDAPFAPAALDGEDSDRLAAGRELYEDIRGRLDHEPLGETILRLWYRYGYRYVLLRRPANQPYLEFADYFFKLAEVARYRSAAQFLDFLRENLGTYKRMAELDILHERAEGVQVMTIHKAKGLEFPVVFLANAGNTGRKEGTGTRPYFISDEHGLTLNMPAREGRDRHNYLYIAEKEESERKDTAELKRLLYVALTRAESHLLISGAYNRSNRNSVEHHLAMVLGAIGYDPDEKRIARTDAPDFLEVEDIPTVKERDLRARLGRGAKRDTATAAREYAARPVIRRRPVRREFSATALNRACRELFPPTGEQELPSLATDDLLSEGQLEAQFGSLCHWLLEFVVREGVPGVWIPGAGSTGAADTSDAPVGRIDQDDLPARFTSMADPDTLDTLLSEAGEIIRRFLGTPAAEPLRTEGLTVESELPFVLCKDFTDRTGFGHQSIRVRGQMDLLVRGAEKLWLYDFKTDRSRRDGDYDMQLALYRDAAVELYELPVETRVVYLREPAAVYTPPDGATVESRLAACVEHLRATESVTRG